MKSMLAQRMFCPLFAAALVFPHYYAHAQEKVSVPGKYSGFSPRLYDSWQRTSFHVPVRDGTRLAVDLYRPVKDGKPVDARYPVVWMHTPYQRGIRQPDGTVKRSGTIYMEARDLALYGYVVAIVDTRGKGASFGWRRGMQDSTEAQDAYDMSEWFARQPWSNGTTGMMGCSYVGGTQDNAAIATPPSLKAIFPGATPFNRYDFVARGGLTAQYHTRPEDPRDMGAESMPVDGDKDGSLLAAAKKDHAQNSIMADIWKDIPFRDDWSVNLGSRFWEESSLSTYRNAVEMRGPVMYRWTGWEDEFSADQFVARANLRNVVKTFIGPETHCRSAEFNMFDEHLRYFDRYLKNIDNGIDREPSIYYYTYNAAPGHEWAASKVWPVAGTNMERYYLAPAATHAALATSKPAKPAAASFQVDYSVITGSLATPYWPVSQFGHGISFETAPFAHDARITGHPVVSLWLSSSATDGDTFAYLEEVAPDGKHAVRAHGRLRASHRMIGSAPYDYLGLPWHRSFRADHQPMRPGVPAELRFDLLPTSTIIRKGYRLRLVVTGADPRQRVFMKADPAPTVTLHGGGRMASYVDIPFVPLEPIAPEKDNAK
jgi:putative CocE/NonD family hydrolase